MDQEKIEIKTTSIQEDSPSQMSVLDNSGWLHNNFGYLLAMFFVAAFVGMLYLIITREVPKTNTELFYTAFGALVGIVNTIMNYYFGSSSSSKEKTKQLNNLINKTV